VEIIKFSAWLSTSPDAIKLAAPVTPIRGKIKPVAAPRIQQHPQLRE